MLVEIAVRDLGPVADLSVVFGPGMTALTGETGAGKTLLTEAIKLLCGSRADHAMVRSGADEAVVEGRFVAGDTEVVARRVVPADGRSRAYLDGNLATAAELAATIGSIVDIHGQHGHQSLVRAASQRAALDAFGRVDTSTLHALRVERREVEALLADLGGDPRARARESELYRYQLDELESAQIDGPDEDDRLQAREALLADAGAHRQAALEAGALIGSDGAVDALARAASLLDGRLPFSAHLERLRDLEAELVDVAQDLSRLGDQIEDDPEQLALVQTRRERLTDLRRKYGATLADVLAYRDEVGVRLGELERHDEHAAALDGRLADLIVEIEAESAVVGAARRAAAPGLAAAVAPRLPELALPNTTIEVTVGDADPGDDVELRVAMNSGASMQPLAKVASGGELARMMLALQLVLSEGAPVMVFDEVDAGVGGEAAAAVGEALAALAARHQVFVVTHLPQVAAHAEQHVQILKHDDGESVEVTATSLDDEERIGELARMLSGAADSETGQVHASEILERATTGRVDHR
ncbi:MAG: AAA family ATPase [Acidimicrobiia bacterium]|nr:AAA family ATPase [Acidimicrobiia bacterium]